MTRFSSLTSKSLLTAAALASFAVVALPQQADAGWRHRGYGYRGGAVAAGVIGGLAVGALIAGAARPAYAAPAYVDEECYWTRERRVTRDGYVVVRKVRVCE
jgi:hypothetical protein